MLESDAVALGAFAAGAAKPQGFGALLDSVTESIAGISGAASVFEPLPEIFARLAGLLRFDRVLIVEIVETHAAVGAQSAHSLLFQWAAPECTASPLCAEALTGSGEVDLVRAEPLVMQ